jgi:hypothetical protein
MNISGTTDTWSLLVVAGLVPCAVMLSESPAATGLARTMVTEDNPGGTPTFTDCTTSGAVAPPGDVTMAEYPAVAPSQLIADPTVALAFKSTTVKLWLRVKADQEASVTE